MSVSAASLAASLADLQSTMGAVALEPVHGPLTLADELRDASRQARTLLAGSPFITDSSRVVIERLTVLVEAAAGGGGCLNLAHHLEGLAADILISDVEDHCAGFAGTGSRRQRLRGATVLLEDFDMDASVGDGSTDVWGPESLDTIARDLFERIHQSKGDILVSWANLSHTERQCWIDAVAHVSPHY